MPAVNDLLGNAILMFFVIPAGIASFDYFRQKGAALAESAAYSMLAVVMALSWLAQVLLLLGDNRVYLPAMTLCAVLACVRLVVCRSRIQTYMRSAYRFAGRHRLAVTGLMAAWGYTAAAYLLGIFGSNAPAAEFWQLLPDHPNGILAMRAHCLPVLNHLVFAAPWQPVSVAPVALLAAYMAIGFGTYALARRYAWPSMAVTVSLLVSGMPRLVYQSMAWGGGELPVAAAALVSILALYRLIEKPIGVDLVMLFSTAAFTVEGGRLCYLIALVLTALSVILFVRRHGMDWLQLKDRLPRGQLLVGLLAMVVFLQPGIVAANLFWGRPWIGVLSHQTIIFNPDPLMGTMGNLVRYLLSALDFPELTDTFWRYVFGVELSTVLDLVYRRFVASVIGSAGAATAFCRTSGCGGSHSWFGMVGFLLVLPAIAFSLWRGPRRLKATALAMLVYWMLVALIVAWQPENVRLMTVFFVCSGFFMAFSLPPWRLGRNGCLLLQILGILQIVHVQLA